ncbi:MAG: hypothetical protein ACR2KK_03780 [Acidimicrobiales bacterium]
MNDIERRLADLRVATRGHLRPSPDLLRRIESSVEPRMAWRWIPAIALVAASIAILAIVVLPRAQEDVDVASRPPTRAEYVQAMNQRCEEYLAETEQVQVVFPTPEAYALAAENRIAAVTRSLDRIRFVGAPPGAPDLLNQVTREAESAQASAETARAAAQAGDTASAAISLADAESAVNRVGGFLAGYGAERCRPPGTP